MAVPNEEGIMRRTHHSTHGDFADYSEITAENYVAKAVVGDEEVEQAMLGEIDPNCRMTTHLS
jgi:hypothetical protein